ncbi:MAG: phosphate-starvation-inducible PsiE family protein [Nitrospiraceae bacterium]|nr:phosphate-starvation-inducible PsiE family protein [Nitrospiraceae bacterium]
MTGGGKETAFHFWMRGDFRKYMEAAMDLVLIALVLLTLLFIAKAIYLLGIIVYVATDIPSVISEFLFIFILVEIMRILIIYIEFRRVSVDIMIELSIVAILREILLKGALEMNASRIAGVSLLIAVLGLLLKFGFIRAEPGGNAGAKSRPSPEEDGTR